MKKFIYTVLSVILISGCSYQGQKLQTYIEDPETLVKDPHFAGHKEKLSALESSYLNKEITYADYIKQKTELEEKYSKEVQERNEIFSY